MEATTHIGSWNERGLIRDLDKRGFSLFNYVADCLQIEVLKIKSKLQ